MDDDDQLCDVVTALLNQPLPRNSRIGILTIGGGLGVAAAEACEREGLEIAPLASSTVQKLDACLPSRWPRRNPVDMTGVSMAQSRAIFSSLWPLMEDENIDAILLQAPMALGTKRLSSIFNAEELRAFKKMEESNFSLLRQRVNEFGKPVFIVRPSIEYVTDPATLSLLRRERIITYQSPRRAARVLHHLTWYRHYLDSAET